MMDPVAGIVEAGCGRIGAAGQAATHGAPGVATSGGRAWIYGAEADGAAMGAGAEDAAGLEPVGGRGAAGSGTGVGSRSGLRHGLVRMNGEDLQVKLFCMRSRYSGKSVCAGVSVGTGRRCSWTVRSRGSAGTAGVFPTVVFDNLKTAVKRVLRGKARIEQDRFTAFRAHYTFEARFCNPARGQEKGGVEGLVGFARRNFRCRFPEVADLEDLNAQLLERCATTSAGSAAGPTTARSGKRHAAEQERLLALPETPFENTKVWVCGSAGTRPRRWIRTGTRCRPRMWDAVSGPYWL